MRGSFITFGLCAGLAWLCGCGWERDPRGRPSDRRATPETVALYRNLKTLSLQGTMFGHQDTVLYGIGWKGDAWRSDIASVCGDFPAVFGWEVGHIELGEPASLDGVAFEAIREGVRFAHRLGGVNTISWHPDNPLTGGTAWDCSDSGAVRSILPGGERHELFCGWLDRLGDFLNSLTAEDGSPIPLIFRPYHEFTGSWFWWGKELCREADYCELWRFTVAYLCKRKQAHHLLLAYSSDYVGDRAGYLARYPGDRWVDVLGFDLYNHGMKDGLYAYRPDLTNAVVRFQCEFDAGMPSVPPGFSAIELYGAVFHDAENSREFRNFRHSVAKISGLVSREAAARNKLCALTETGCERVPVSDWWTRGLLEAVRPYPLAYVMTWRNAYEREGHYYGPYPGHHSADDFVRFYEDSRTLFLRDLPALYR